MRKSVIFLGRMLAAAACLLMLLANIGAPVHAEETTDIAQLFQQQLEASGANDLWNQLPEQTVELMKAAGMSAYDVESLSALQPQTALSAFFDLFSGQAKGPLLAGGILLGIVLICAMLEGLKSSGGTANSMSHVYQIVGALAACGALITPLAITLQRVQEAAESTMVFTVSFTPVFAGVLAAGGMVTSAATYQSVLLGAADVVSVLISSVIVPLLTMSLAMGLTGAIGEGMRLGDAGSLLNKAAVWLLGITVTVFVGLLGIQGLVSAAADSAGGRALRFSVASFVPVVGGALSEALYTVRGCLSMLKSTVGGFGILATALMVLPPLLECIAWSFCLGLCRVAADMFELGGLSRLFGVAKGVVNTLIGALSACALLTIISTTIMTLAASGL